MTNGARRDLFDWSAAAFQAKRIVFGCQIADQRSDALLAMQYGECFSSSAVLPEPGLDTMLMTRTAGFTEALAQLAGKKIVLFQNSFADFDDARLCAHSYGSISIRTISRSWPSVSSMMSCEPSTGVPSQTSP